MKQLVAFPTETVYGLGAPIFSREAILEIFRLKGRPADNPLIAHISDLSQVERIARDLPDTFFQLAEAFWPGPLTLVVKKKPEVPMEATGGRDTIAIRMPDHPLALKHIHSIGEAVVAPSANLSGRPSPTTAAHVREDFHDAVHVIDGGPCRHGIESTVLSLLDTPTILRPGSITAAQLADVLGHPIEMAPPNAPHLSPGTKYRHYAPDATVRLFATAEELSAFATQTHSERHKIIHPTAQNLYAHLRDADREGCTEVLVLTQDLSPALLNRLLKASQQSGL